MSRYNTFAYTENENIANSYSLSYLTQSGAEECATAETMQATVAELQANNAQLDAQIAELESQLAESKRITHNEALKHQIQKYKSKSREVIRCVPIFRITNGTQSTYLQNEFSRYLV